MNQWKLLHWRKLNGNALNENTLTRIQTGDLWFPCETVNIIWMSSNNCRYKNYDYKNSLFNNSVFRWRKLSFVEQLREIQEAGKRGTLGIKINVLSISNNLCYVSHHHPLITDCTFINFVNEFSVKFVLSFTKNFRNQGLIFIAKFSSQFSYLGPYIYCTL